jgi:predicted peptidase
MRIGPARFVRSAAFLAILVLGASLPAADVKEVFQARTYRDCQGNELRYRLMLPANYNCCQSYPLVVFLHGAGERGDDNVAQLVHGMKDFASDENRAKYPCIVFAPQCPKEQSWAKIDLKIPKHTMTPEPTGPTKQVLCALAALQTEYNVDRTRIYLTGLSMGGFGTWDLIQRYPGTFAAAIPICGGGDEAQAARLIHVPLWAFHGSEDKGVVPERSRDMIAAVKQAGGKPRYTEYDGVGHDSWTATYADPKVMEWLFSQRLTNCPCP